MYKALYREYRPEIFEEMLGQEHIVKILKNQVENDTVSHAYLFCGTRGTGKTTTARLLAKAVNCLDDNHRPCGKCANCMAIKEGTFMDLIEIDAASNNGINDIRELRESVNFPPAIGRKKVYIIDEVHMLSKEAFNGFLKTLEEPPVNVMFILATTEPQKLPQTILSRCIRMDFRRVLEHDLVDRMEKICGERGVDVDVDTLKLVAANADGSVRDGLTLLDQCISGRNGKVTREEVLDALGAVGEETYIEITNSIINKDVSRCMLTLNKIMSGGKDARQVLMGLISHYRNLLLTKYVKNPEDMLNMSLENVERVRKQSEILDLAEINDAIIELSQTSADMTHTTQPRILLELVLVKLASGLMVREAVAVPKGATSISKPVEMKSSVSEPAVDKSTKQAEPPMAEGDMEEIWDRVCEEAGRAKPSLIILRRCTLPRSMSAGEFVVAATNETAKMMIEKEKHLLTEIFERLTGTAKHITIAGSKRSEEDERDIEELASIAENYLGIDVKIE